jgi:hypothetical protein
MEMEELHKKYFTFFIINNNIFYKILNKPVKSRVLII